MYYILGDIAPKNVSIPLNATKSKYFMYKESNIMCILKMDSQPLSEFLSGLHESMEKKVAAMYNLSLLVPQYTPYDALDKNGQKVHYSHPRLVKGQTATLTSTFLHFFFFMLNVFSRGITGVII